MICVWARSRAAHASHFHALRDLLADLPVQNPQPWRHILLSGLRPQAVPATKQISLPGLSRKKGGR
jgi:hypothetical protein